MINTYRLALVTLLIVASSVYAAEKNKPSKTAYPGHDLREIISIFSKKNKMKFLLDPRLTGKVEYYGERIEDIDYGTLLTILNIWGFSTVEIDGIINVMPDVNTKQSSIPVSINGEGEYEASQLITAIVDVKYVPANNLVPILRPYVPQQGHMAALTGSKKILITDRYSNVKRLVNIIRSLDVKDYKAPM